MESASSAGFRCASASPISTATARSHSSPTPATSKPWPVSATSQALAKTCIKSARACAGTDARYAHSLPSLPRISSCSGRPCAASTHSWDSETTTSVNDSTQPTTRYANDAIAPVSHDAQDAPCSRTHRQDPALTSLAYHTQGPHHDVRRREARNTRLPANHGRIEREELLRKKYGTCRRRLYRSAVLDEGRRRGVWAVSRPSTLPGHSATACRSRML